jgi:crotonobetainyl-CoA:carnitine CoA-transferase CaiB-like acyl-CoA transferase
MLNLMEGIIPEYSRKGVIRGPSGSSVTGIVPTNAYPTRVPSAYVVIGANGDSIYVRLMQAISRPDLVGPNYARNQQRVERQAEIEEAISNWTKERTPEEVCKVMDEARVPVGRIMNVKDIMENEHVNERGMVERVKVISSARVQAKTQASSVEDAVEKPQVEEWDLDVPRVAPLLECEARTRWAGPNLGQHNDEILKGELGLSEQEMDELRKDGIIGETPV